MASRVVHCEDALAWLQREAPPEDASFITSLPDVSELGGKTLSAWKHWFVDTASQIVSRTPPRGVAIFFQTDIKSEGTWVDKGYLASRGAELAGAECLFHRVVCRAPPGTITFGRPAYAHLLAFSRELRLEPKHSFADVMPHLGEMTWARAMGADACVAAVRFVRDHTQSHTVIDPFCGQGSVLAVANALGLDAVGVELSRKRAERARTLQWTAERGFHTPI